MTNNLLQSQAMNSIKTIAVGSKNPVKIQSAQAGFEQMFPGTSFLATGFSVESDVSDQPMSGDETLLGATNRANKLCQLAGDANYFVGIEGGIEIVDGEYFAHAWVVVIDQSGDIARGRSGSFALPRRVQQLVESGVELGHANDEVFKEQNSKQRGGAVGSLTGGVISRQSLYEHAVVLALIPFKQPDLFN